MSGRTRRYGRCRTAGRWRDRATGERQERTEWHKVVVFNEYLIPVIKQYVKKGSKLFLQGAIKSRKYNDKQGIERWVTEIVLGAFQSELALLDRAERAPPPEEDAYGSDSSRSSTRDQMDDEVPF